MEVNDLDLVGEGYMQWQLGREMGTIPAFASRTQENQENLGRDGRKPGSRNSMKIFGHQRLLYDIVEFSVCVVRQNYHSVLSNNKQLLVSR